MEVAYHSFNFCVTAWHIVDWLYEEEIGIDDDKERKAFADKMQGEHRPLVYMRVVTTYSKHAGCHNDDRTFLRPRVSAGSTLVAESAVFVGVPPNDDPVEVVKEWFRPKADIAGESRQMVEIFEEVLSFWRKRLG